MKQPDGAQIREIRIGLSPATVHEIVSKIETAINAELRKTDLGQEDGYVSMSMPIQVELSYRIKDILDAADGQVIHDTAN